MWAVRRAGGSRASLAWEENVQGDLTEAYSCREESYKIVGSRIDSTSKGYSSELQCGRPWKNFKENLLTRRVAKDRERFLRDVVELHSWKGSGLISTKLSWPWSRIGDGSTSNREAGWETCKGPLKYYRSVGFGAFFSILLHALQQAAVCCHWLLPTIPCLV